MTQRLRGSLLNGTPFTFLPKVSVSPAFVFSRGRRLVPGYNGPIIRIVNPTSLATMDIYAGADNKLQVSEVPGFLGANLYGEIDREYEQTGTGLMGTSATSNQRPQLWLTQTVNGEYSATVNGPTPTTSQRMTYPSGVTADAKNYSRTDVYLYKSSNRAALYNMGANFTTGTLGFWPGNNGASQNGFRSTLLLASPSGAKVATVARGRSQPQICTLVSGASNIKVYQDDYVHTLTANSTATFAGGINYFLDGTTAYSFSGEHYHTIIWGGQLSASDVAIVHKFFYGVNAILTQSDAQLVLSGNSLVEGLRSLNGMNYARLMEPRLKRKIFVSNQGVSSQTLDAVLTNIAYYKSQFRSDLAKNLFIAPEPTNDIFALSGAGIPGAGLTLYNKLVSIVDNSTGMRSAGFAVAAPTTTSRIWSSGGDNAAKETERVDYNTRLKAGAAGLGIAVLDFDGFTESQTPSNSTYFDADQLHWTSTLHGVFAPAAASWCNTVL